MIGGCQTEVGDARGHSEGNTLVVETTNLSDQTSIGGNGNGLRHSADMKITERFTPTAPDELKYEIYVDDPKTYTRPFTISTQVGCAMACGFCLTRTMGLARNLTAGDIVGQVRVLADALDMRRTRFNIVLMGMGEPLHNYDETMRALRMLADEHGLAVSPRRVTLSTVGLLPALDRLAREAIMPNLAISLHAPTDAIRGELVPLNRKYGVADIIAACKRFPLKRRSRITFEYVMLAGVNDAPEDARRLARLLADVRSKVNLIPLNPAPGIPYQQPSDEAVDRFARILADHHLTVSVRESRGRDIRAACGQLIVEGERPSPGQQLATLAFGE